MNEGEQDAPQPSVHSELEGLVAKAFLSQLFSFGKNCPLSRCRHGPLPARAVNKPFLLQALQAAIDVALRNARRSRPILLRSVGFGDHCSQKLRVTIRFL